MAQILQLDRIGALSQNAGIISLAASVLTIGGQQYTTSVLTRTISTDITMAANTLYMIFAVLNSGAVELRISSNVNSIGPSGFTSWKLVGAFYANGNSSVAFGSFVNIEGVPTSESFDFLPSTSWLANTNYSGKLQRSGERWVMNAAVNTVGPPTAAQLQFNMPTNITIDTTKVVYGNNAINVFGTSVANDFGVGLYNGNVLVLSSSSSGPFYPYWNNGTSAGGVTNTSPFSFSTNDSLEIQIDFPGAGLSKTPLKDL